MKSSLTAVFCFFVLAANLGFLLLGTTTCTASEAPSSDLVVGYYDKSCPLGEDLVRRVVFRAVAANPGLGAGLLRLHFHDCFVRGCDASVLLDSIRRKPAEKDSRANIGLRGFEVIEAAKQAVEALCPKVMSCVDILAMATARDSATLIGGITYQLPCGRLDGRICLKDEPTKNLPRSSATIDQLENKFVNQGLTMEDMVALSAAHSLGVAHCSSFRGTLYAFNPTHDTIMDGTDEFIIDMARKG